MVTLRCFERFPARPYVVVKAKVAELAGSTVVATAGTAAALSPEFQAAVAPAASAPAADAVAAAPAAAAAAAAATGIADTAAVAAAAAVKRCRLIQRNLC